MRHSTCPFSTKGWRRINKHSLGASKMIQTTFYCFSVSAKSPMAVGILNRCLENGWMRANKLKVNLKKILVCQSMEKLLGDYRVSLYWAGCTSLKKQVHSSFIASKCYRILTYNRGWCGCSIFYQPWLVPQLWPFLKKKQDLTTVLMLWSHLN